MVHTASHINPVVLYLCATTMVVRLVQTLAREAWMALSLDVSSADVAYRKSLGESLCPPEVPGCSWRSQGESGLMTYVLVRMDVAR